MIRAWEEVNKKAAYHFEETENGEAYEVFSKLSYCEVGVNSILSLCRSS
jgi:hypothetical protein